MDGGPHGASLMAPDPTGNPARPDFDPEVILERSGMSLSATRCGRRDRVRSPETPPGRNGQVTPFGGPPPDRYPEAPHEQDRQVSFPGGEFAWGMTPREGPEPLKPSLHLAGRTSTAAAAVVSVVAVVVVQLALFPVPVGVWLQGAVLGLARAW